MTWISVFAPTRTPSDRNTNACSATAPVQPRKSSTVASEIDPPPNGPGLVGRAADTALTITSIEPNSARARSSASRSDSGSLASASNGSPPAARTVSSVSAERATAAPFQPACR